MKSEILFNLQKNYFDYIMKSISDGTKILLNCVKNTTYTPERAAQLEKNHYSSLSDDFYYKALYKFFIESDVQSTKQSFLLSAKMSLYEFLFFDYTNLFVISNYPLSAMLLSDNIKLIEAYANITYDTYEKDLKKGHPMPFVQAVLRDDWKYLKEKIDYNREHFTSKKSNIWFKYDLDFFEGLLNGDELKMKDAIIYLAGRGHRRRNDRIYRKDLISIPALSYAKLAYIKGYELDIDHPLIPKELLPVRPNDEYWEYDFMKEGKYKNV